MKHPELAGACHESVEWANGYATLEEAWKACERPEWMCWWGRRMVPNDRKWWEVACDIAEIAVQRYWVPRYPEDRRPQAAIEARRRWVRGEVSDDVLRAAADAAAYAAHVAAYVDAYAAAYAAYAYAAADAAYGAAYGARLAMRAEACDIIRKYFPEFPRKENHVEA